MGRTQAAGEDTGLETQRHLEGKESQWRVVTSHRSGRVVPCVVQRRKHHVLDNPGQTTRDISRACCVPTRAALAHRNETQSRRNILKCRAATNIVTKELTTTVPVPTSVVAILSTTPIVGVFPLSPPRDPPRDFAIRSPRWISRFQITPTGYPTMVTI